MTTRDTPASKPHSDPVLRAWPVYLAIFLVAGFLGLVFSQGSPKPPFRANDITGADYANDFHLTDMDGHPRSIADYRGRRHHRGDRPSIQGLLPTSAAR